MHRGCRRDDDRRSLINDALNPGNIFCRDELGLLIRNLKVIQILAENPEGANTRTLWTIADGREDSAIDAAKVKAGC